MILDLPRFITQESPLWRELDETLASMEGDAARRLSLSEVRRFHYLYERASADLARLQTFAAEPETRRYLEALVARAYGQTHGSRGRAAGFSPRAWFTKTFPRTFRRRIGAFWLAAAVTLSGALFGGLSIAFDPDSKAILIGDFGHLGGDPSERVEREETQGPGELEHSRAAFSAQLMTHNTRVSILGLALGMTWGVGTLALLFYNGVILGAVAADYLGAGQGAFLAGWLMPHGVIEIPAVLIASQAGLVLAGTLLGRRSRQRLGVRLREAAPDLVTLVSGAAALLVWAGLMEAFLSQYHEPFIPYALKAGFGLLELLFLVLFLGFAGRGGDA